MPPKRTRFAFTAACLVVACSIVGLSAAPAGSTPAPGPTPRAPVVVVYGDSIVHAAAAFVQAALAPYGVTLVDASVGGTAPCDALQFVSSDMQRYDPELVVIAYVGNALSPCMIGTAAPDVYARHYADTSRLVGAIGHRPILLDTPPGSVGQGHFTAYDVLVHYEASSLGARIADTAAALIDPATELFETSMPCMITTICTRIEVRGPDGYHLTPAGGYLYAQALIRAVLTRLRVSRHPRT